jgi:uncharacterized membrane protein YidH (DUF202 family)
MKTNIITMAALILLILSIGVMAAIYFESFNN